MPPIPELFDQRPRRRLGVWMALVAALGAFAMVAAGCGGGSDSGSSGGGGETATTAAATTEAAVEAPAELVKAGTLTFGADPSYPPLNSIEGGEHVGFEPELAELLAAQFGLELAWVDVGFDSLVPSLQAKKYDAVLSDLYVTEERAEVVDFIPYNTEGVALITKADSDYAPTKDTDLCGKTVASVSGSFQIPFFAADGETGKKCPPDEPIEVNTFRTEPLVMEEVAAGRADVATSTVASGTKVIQDHPELGLKISPPEAVLYESPVAIAVNEHADELKGALEEAMANLEASGELQELLDKYGLPAAPKALVAEALAGQD